MGDVVVDSIEITRHVFAAPPSQQQLAEILMTTFKTTSSGLEISNGVLLCPQKHQLQTGDNRPMAMTLAVIGEVGTLHSSVQGLGTGPPQHSLAVRGVLDDCSAKIDVAIRYGSCGGIGLIRA